LISERLLLLTEPRQFVCSIRHIHNQDYISEWTVTQKLCNTMEGFYFGKSSLPSRKCTLHASRFPHGHNGYLLTGGKLPHGSEWYEPLSTWQFVEMHSIGCFYLIWGDILESYLVDRVEYRLRRMGSRSHKTCHKVTIAVLQNFCYISHRTQIGSMPKALKYYHSLGFQGSRLKLVISGLHASGYPQALASLSRFPCQFQPPHNANGRATVIQKSPISFLIFSLLFPHTKSCLNIYYGQNLFIDIIYHHNLRFALYDSLIQ
jgi:hypothetical protein